MRCRQDHRTIPRSPDGAFQPPGEADPSRRPKARTCGPRGTQVPAPARGGRRHCRRRRAGVPRFRPRPATLRPGRERPGWVRPLRPSAPLPLLPPALAGRRLGCMRNRSAYQEGRLSDPSPIATLTEAAGGGSRAVAGTVWRSDVGASRSLPPCRVWEAPSTETQPTAGNRIADTPIAPEAEDWLHHSLGHDPAPESRGLRESIALPCGRRVSRRGPPLGSAGDGARHQLQLMPPSHAGTWDRKRKTRLRPVQSRGSARQRLADVSHKPFGVTSFVQQERHSTAPPLGRWDLCGRSP